eukprot:Em0689g3a
MTYTYIQKACVSVANCQWTGWISAMKNKVHHRSAVVLFQWEKHSNQECKLVKKEQQAGLLKRAISTSSKGIIQLGTGGTNEVLSLGDEQRRALLKEAGISDEIKIGPAEVLAIKEGSWRKPKRRTCSFSLSLPSGGEEFRGAPLVFIPDLILKVVELLEENDRAGRLTWHNGVIPASEIWIKLGGDKGGGTFKMNFQIVNLHQLAHSPERYKEQVETPTANDMEICPPGLHITMGIFKKLFELFEDFCHSLDLELAFYHTEVDQSRYSLYSQELQRLHQYKVELQESKTI